MVWPTKITPPTKNGQSSATDLVLPMDPVPCAFAPPSSYCVELRPHWANSRLVLGPAKRLAPTRFRVLEHRKARFSRPHGQNAEARKNRSSRMCKLTTECPRALLTTWAKSGTSLRLSPSSSRAISSRAKSKRSRRRTYHGASSSTSPRWLLSCKRKSASSKLALIPLIPTNRNGKLKVSVSSRWVIMLFML